MKRDETKIRMSERALYTDEGFKSFRHFTPIHTTKLLKEEGGWSIRENRFSLIKNKGVEIAPSTPFRKEEEKTTKEEIALPSNTT